MARAIYLQGAYLVYEWSYKDVTIQGAYQLLSNRMLSKWRNALQSEASVKIAFYRQNPKLHYLVKGIEPIQSQSIASNQIDIESRKRVEPIWGHLNISSFTALFFGLIGLVVYLACVFSDHQEELFRTQSIEATGTVIDHITYTKNGSVSDYSIRYTFPAEDNKIYTALDNVDQRTYDQLKEGDKISILYLKNDPLTSRATVGLHFPAASPLSVAGFFLVLVGPLLMISVFLSVRRLRLSRYGTKTRGVVTEVAFVPISKRGKLGQMRPYLCYEWTTTLGETHWGKSQLNHALTAKAFAERLALGRLVCDVYYDPQKPSRHFFANVQNP